MGRTDGSLCISAKIFGTPHHFVDMFFFTWTGVVEQTRNQFSSVFQEYHLHLLFPSLYLFYLSRKYRNVHQLG
jgi:hypothetical protein